MSESSLLVVQRFITVLMEWHVGKRAAEAIRRKIQTHKRMNERVRVCMHAYTKVFFSIGDIRSEIVLSVFCFPLYTLRVCPSL